VTDGGHADKGLEDVKMTEGNSFSELACLLAYLLTYLLHGEEFFLRS